VIRFLFLVTLPFYALDQLTKWLVLRDIATEEAIVVIPNFFSLVQVHNTGAAFGMLSDNNLFFIALSSVALVALAVFWARGAFRDRWLGAGAALLAAGILGNLTDRILHRFVVDFLLFDLHVPFANPWPAFNIADSCICVAAAIFVVHSLTDGNGKRPAHG
jgi:signal peptidase II